MDRGVQNSDGAFQRFLSSAFATILTIMFSWRFLLEEDSTNLRMLEDKKNDDYKYLEPDDLSDDTKPYTARATADKRRLPDTKGISKGSKESRMASNVAESPGAGTSLKASSDNKDNTIKEFTASSDARDECPANIYGGELFRAAHGWMLPETLVDNAISIDRGLGTSTSAGMTSGQTRLYGAETGSHGRDSTHVISRQQMAEASLPSNPPSVGVIDINTGVSMDSDTESTVTGAIGTRRKTGTSTKEAGTDFNIGDKEGRTIIQRPSKVYETSFRSTDSLKWLEDDPFEEDDDVFFEEGKPSSKRCLPGDLAAFSSIPHRKLKEFEQFLASEDSSENQLGARLLEHYLMHDPNLDDSSESDYCDFNRTLDTITEEDTSDLETSENEGWGDSCSTVRRRRRSFQEVSVRQREEHKDKNDLMGNTPLNKNCSAEEQEADVCSVASESVSEATCASDTHPSTSDNGSIEVSIEQDTGYDAIHRYAHIKPQRSLIIGPYQDRDSNFSKEHFIGAEKNHKDQDQSNITDNRGQLTDKDTTPVLALVDCFNRAGSTVSPAMVGGGGITPDYNDTTSQGTDSIKPSFIDSSSLEDHRAHKRVETDDISYMSGEGAFDGRRQQRHTNSSPTAMKNERGITEKSIMTAAVADDNSNTGDGDTSPKADLDLEQATARGEQVKILNEQDYHTGLADSASHNEVNTEQSGKMMDANSQVNERPIIPQHVGWLTGPGESSRLGEAATGEVANQRGGAHSHGKEAKRNQLSNSNAVNNSAYNSSSVNNPNHTNLGGHHDKNSWNDAESDLRAVGKCSLIATGAQFALADDQASKQSRSIANVLNVEGLRRTDDTGINTYELSDRSIAEAGGHVNIHSCQDIHQSGRAGDNVSPNTLRPDQVSTLSTLDGLSTTEAPYLNPTPDTRPFDLYGLEKFNNARTNNQIVSENVHLKRDTGKDVTIDKTGKEFSGDIPQQVTTTGGACGKAASVDVNRTSGQGETSPNRWIFTTAKNPYTFDIPAEGGETKDTLDEHPLRYHSTGELPYTAGRAHLEDNSAKGIKRPIISPRKGFKDIHRAIKGPSPPVSSTSSSIGLISGANLLPDRTATLSSPLPTVETYRFYHNRIEVPFKRDVSTANDKLTLKDDQSSRRYLYRLDQSQPINTGNRKGHSIDILSPGTYLGSDQWEPTDNSVKSKPQNLHEFEQLEPGSESVRSSLNTPTVEYSDKTDSHSGRLLPLDTLKDTQSSDRPYYSGVLSVDSQVHSKSPTPASADTTALGITGAVSPTDTDTEKPVIRRSDRPFNQPGVCTAVATSTALAKREAISPSDSDLSTERDSIVSAVASAEASGLNPYIAIGRASARAATIATASAANTAVNRQPDQQDKSRNIAVVISTSCRLEGTDQEVQRDAEAIIQTMDEKSTIRSTSGAIMDASTQSSPDLREKRRKFRVTIEQPDTQASTRETRTIEFELPPGTDASQFSSLVTNAVKTIMDECAQNDAPGISEQEKFDKAVQNIARDVMQAYSAQTSQTQDIQVKRRKKNKNCFYVRGLPRANDNHSDDPQRVLGVISDGGHPTAPDQSTGVEQPSQAVQLEEPTTKRKSKKRKSKKSDKDRELDEEVFTGPIDCDEKGNPIDPQSPLSSSPPKGEVKLRSILKRPSDSTAPSMDYQNTVPQRGDRANTSQGEPMASGLNERQNGESITGLRSTQRPNIVPDSLGLAWDRDRSRSIHNQPLYTDPEVQIGRHAWPPTKSASLPYNWPPRKASTPRDEPKKEYKSVLQDPIPVDTKTPLILLKQYEKPEKVPSDTSSKITESRKGYFDKDKEGSQSTTDLDSEFEARKLQTGKSLTKPGLMLVDIDFSAPLSPTKPDSPETRIEDLKRRLQSARPKPPSGSYVDKVWNARELISKSHEKGLDKEREYILDEETPLSPSQARSIENLRRSKSLGLLPSTFFSQTKRNSSLLEPRTDLDIEVGTDQPSGSQLSIDKMDMSKSMGNLKEDDVLVSSYSNEYDRHKSMLVLSENDGNDSSRALPRDQRDYDKNKSANELRVSKSLSKLNVPLWYTQSARPNQEIVILNNAHTRDLAFSSSRPWASKTIEQDKLQVAPARPVVIRHRVRSPIRSPGTSLSSTPVTPPEEFELPSTRLRRNSPQYRTMPIQSYKEIYKDLPHETGPKRPAKDAYLDLKEQLMRAPPERGSRSYKSLPADIRKEREPNYQVGRVQAQLPTQMLEDQQHSTQEDVRVTSGAIKVSRKGSDPHEEPSIQRYSTESTISVSAPTQGSAPQGRPKPAERKSSGKKKRKHAKKAIESHVDGAHSSKETDSARQAVDEPRYHTGHIAGQDTTNLINSTDRDNNPVYMDGSYSHGYHNDSVNDSGIVDINNGGIIHTEVQRYPVYSLSQDELNERNRIISTEESFRYEYMRPQQQPQPCLELHEAPDRSPLQQSNDNSIPAENQYFSQTAGEDGMMTYQTSPGAQRRHKRGGSRSPVSPAARARPDENSMSPTSFEVYSINKNRAIKQLQPELQQPQQLNTSAANSLGQTEYIHPCEDPEEEKRDREPPQSRAFRLLREAALANSRSLNVSQMSNMSFDVEMVGDESNHFPPISDNKTSVVVSAMGNETIMVKCRNQKCGKTVELGEARKSYKTCHNCYTYYCSRDCRKSHWERHKKKCLFSKVNSICKHVMKRVHDDERLSVDFTRVARAGYLSKGRGSVLLLFSSHMEAEEFLTIGLDASKAKPIYCSMEELEAQSNSFGEHYFELVDMCRSYNPEIKFVMDVIVIASMDGELQARAPRREGPAFMKCTKLRLSTAQTRPAPANPEAETLILTAMPRGEFADQNSGRKAREVSFINIQRQLRQRGVSLRHHYPEVYSKLCSYVADNEHFTPITIFPFDENTGKRFMCMIMPDSDHDSEWLSKPDLLKQLGLNTEL